MVFDRFRGLGNRIMFPIAKKLKWMNPDILTWISFLICIGVGVLFYIDGIEMLVLIAVLIALAGFLDYLDGSIAKVNKKETKRGDFLDHTLDRFSDAAIFGGLAISGLVNIYAGFAAVIAILLVSYMGTQAHALTGKRDYSGILGRADRMIFLIAAIIIQYFLSAYAVLQLFVYIVIITGAITIAQRFVKTWRLLS
ncbi:MAG: CDP-alcohol phosphatidyltransferase family protein [Candidatus Nanoarchaeia archaeon]|nr:CDP-alcohol phosphatidyltransferase family protein [Candidatus Nanoarchaeia archaeon]MDD5239498.1 CDP-alcohol phosphatidyltransferase family protein [Candidatus Nanoarchaeia archaeon]